MTIEQLARQTLSVLALQREYFDTRSSQKLAECRDAERRLKSACEEILHPPTAGLFDGQANEPCAKG